MHDQNITVQRYERPLEVGWYAAVSPADGSWALYIPNEPGEAPKLHLYQDQPTDTTRPVPAGLSFDLAPATFGEAIEMLRAGKAVQRKGWNGKGMFLVLNGEWEGELSTPTVEENEPGHQTIEEGVRGLTTSPFIAMVTADRKLVPWLASQTDVLSTDWLEVTSNDVLEILDSEVSIEVTTGR